LSASTLPLHSGSGSVVRQAVAYAAAVTGQPVRVVNVRVRRPNPGLHHQHLRDPSDLQAGQRHRPRRDAGRPRVQLPPWDGHPRGRHTWDIGSAGSATMVALALLPLLMVG